MQFVLPSTGLIKNSLFVGVRSHESCHSSMHSLDICGKELSGSVGNDLKSFDLKSLFQITFVIF